MAIKSHPVPKVGDTVTLNQDGLESLFGGYASSLSHMMTKKMKIVHIDSESMTAPELSYMVTVDDPGIAELMITHWGFDIVKEKR